MLATRLNATEAEAVRELLRRLPSFAGIEEPSDDELNRVLRSVIAQAQAEWREVPPQTVAPPRDDVFGMVLVRKRRQLAYTLKLSNLERDPFALLQALGLTAAGAVAAPALIVAPPPTFPSFLLAIAFAWLRAFAQPIGYGEAALLHYINQTTTLRGRITHEELQDAGQALVTAYGYVKGRNHNEVASLLSSLLAWRAVEEWDGGYRARETVPFGLGPIEYAPRAS